MKGLTPASEPKPASSALHADGELTPLRFTTTGESIDRLANSWLEDIKLMELIL